MTAATPTVSRRLAIPPEALAAAADHAERTYPEECCGFLIGRRRPEGAEVTRAVSAVNERPEEQPGERRHRYLIGPETVLLADRAARAEGLEIVGYYHSHPDRPAVPSAFDREHAWAGASYLIVPVAGGEAGPVRSWRLTGAEGSFVEETVVTGAAGVEPGPGAGRPRRGA